MQETIHRNTQYSTYAHKVDNNFICEIQHPFFQSSVFKTGIVLERRKKERKNPNILMTSFVIECLLL